MAAQRLRAIPFSVSCILLAVVFKPALRAATARLERPRCAPARNRRVLAVARPCRCPPRSCNAAVASCRDRPPRWHSTPRPRPGARLSIDEPITCGHSRSHSAPSRCSSPRARCSRAAASANGSRHQCDRTGFSADCDRTGRHGGSIDLLALPDRVRGPAPIRTVRQPESLCHVGDHGCAAVARIHHARASEPPGAASAIVSTRARLTRMADGRMVWLTAAAARDDDGASSVDVALGNPRAGRCGGHQCADRSRPTAAPDRRWWLVGVLLFDGGDWRRLRVDIPALADRFAQSGPGLEDRVRIWRDTLPLVRDFWLTGSGVGSYRTAMLYYQRADRVVQFNQAHNHYLQVAAEGGVLVAGTGDRRDRCFGSRLRAGNCQQIWRVRTGFAPAPRVVLLAVALQSVWETGLVMPANAALAAVARRDCLVRAAADRLRVFLWTDGPETGN